MKEGETHYIYANYPDYKSQLKTNVDTPKEQEAFVKFLEKIGPISIYRTYLCVDQLNLELIIISFILLKL